MKRGRIFVLIAVSSIGVWLALCAVIGIVAVEAALHQARLPLTRADEAQARSIAARSNATFADVEVVANDGVVLRAWNMRPLKGNGDAAILLHGVADNRMGMLGNAEMLLRHGFVVLLPDARAHGVSGGPIATYGVKEAYDVREWYEWLVQSRAPRCIDGLGESMGGAQLLRSLQIEHGFCAVVAESAFSTFEEAGYDRLGQAFQTGPWLGRTLLRPALNAGFLYARLKYGVDLRQARPRDAVTESRVPILLIHGRADTNLPPRHSEEMKAANAAVSLWEPHAAEHCGAAGAEPIEYERRVVAWFESHGPATVGIASH